MAGKKKAVTLFLCLANANTELELQTQFFPPFHGRASVKSDLSDLSPTFYDQSLIRVNPLPSGPPLPFFGFGFETYKYFLFTIVTVDISMLTANNLMSNVFNNITR